jgi:hypothetical protein
MMPLSASEIAALGDTRPVNYRQYWAGLTDAERAFEILAGTDAAVYMAYWQEINNSIPKPPIAP